MSAKDVVMTDSGQGSREGTPPTHEPVTTKHSGDSQNVVAKVSSRCCRTNKLKHFLSDTQLRAVACKRENSHGEEHIEISAQSITTDAALHYST